MIMNNARRKGRGGRGGSSGGGLGDD